MAEVLERFGEQPILLHVDAPIRRFRFDRREQSIIDVLRAKLLGLLNAPATKLVTLINTPASQLAQVIKAKSEKGA